ncbi:MAG: AraC family transcriptional regulator [Lachnospiraceae bacterium]|nr:AraC family transcriptional regulator [Lachnospiraceae bacterium]
MIKSEEMFATEGMTSSDRSLHTPGDFARQNLLYVQEVGRLKSLKPHRCVRENLESYLFMVVLGGKGNLVVDGRQYDLRVGDGALVDCREHYEHISDEKDGWELAWVHYYGNMARNFYELFRKGNGGANVFHIEDVEQWNQLIGRLMELQRDRSMLAELQCGELLLHLQYRILQNLFDCGTLADEQERQLVSSVREWLNEHYVEDDISGALKQAFSQGMDEMERSFTQYYGISIDEYVDNRRLNAAKELLRFSIKPVAKVAAESGIGDVVTMQQMFREEEGMSAEEYRQKWAQWIR